MVARTSAYRFRQVGADPRWTSLFQRIKEELDVEGQAEFPWRAVVS